MEQGSAGCVEKWLERRDTDQPGRSRFTAPHPGANGSHSPDNACGYGTKNSPKVTRIFCLVPCDRRVSAGGKTPAISPVRHTNTTNSSQNIWD